MRTVCQKVCLAVSESFRGNPSRAYDAVDATLELLTKEYPRYIGKTELKNWPLYRAVDVKDKGVHDRKRVFHVPFHLRSKMSTTRYSIPGYPALYLGTSIGLNCAEIHRSPQDDTVMAARFEYKDEYDVDASPFLRQPCLIDLSVKPQDFLLPGEKERSPRQALLMGVKTGKPARGLLKSPKDYLLWYPLIAACSYILINREDPYAAEYVVPQLVTQWAKRREAPPEGGRVLSFDKALYGVCYFSCLSEKASEKGLNFAFPSSGSDVWTFEELKNHCPVLSANFRLTEPVFVSEYENPEECEKALQDEERETERIGEFSMAAIKKEIEANGGEYEIPAGEDTVPDWTFDSIEELKKIHIPAGVTSIGRCILAGCTDLRQITVSEENDRYRGINNCIIEKNTGELICGCKESTIPNDGSVTSIGDSAFIGCTGLKDITIPNSVTSIEDWAFSGCTGLTDITIPNGVTTIGDWAFEGCTGLTSLTIPDSVISIGAVAFSGCTGLPSVTIPNSVTNIGKWAFDNCTGLKDITIPDSVTTIGNWAFFSCKNLTIRVPRKFKDLDNHAFDDCKSVIYY